jgi:glyoxylase-like metal-dependent hydrolase (beta-lactamase superfamily II)
MTSFRLGRFALNYLTVGSFEIAPGELFATAPGADLAEALERHDLSPEQLTFQVRALVVDSESNRVVIDPAGDWEDPHRLEIALEEAAIDSDSVDTVIISHGHADHFWGGVRADGRPLFSNARYWIQRSEWQHWLPGENPEPDHAATFQETLLPLEDCFSFAEGAQEIVPGIRSRPAFGHSPGQMAVEIGEVAVYTGDVLLSPPNVEHPEWSSSFDVWPEQVVASRRELLERLGESGALVLTCHFPGSGAGRVVRDHERGGDGWRWQPEEL